MPYKSPDWFVLWMYAIAAVAGGIGGCAAGAMTELKQGNLRFAYFAAYGTIGFVTGGITYFLSDFFNVAPPTLVGHVGWALAMGLLVPLVLAAHNFGAKFAFKLLGGEVQVTFRHDKEERREDEK